MADNTIHLLAPGPSMSQRLVTSLAGKRLGAVGVTWTLAPDAEFLAASDIKWWNAYPEAREFKGRKFSAQATGFTECLPVTTQLNSGVLALHACIAVGATHAVLHGFDMHGTHYFGSYTNGLANTSERRREVHLQQFREFAHRWKRQLHVINATSGSRIDCFPFEGEKE